MCLEMKEFGELTKIYRLVAIPSKYTQTQRIADDDDTTNRPHWLSELNLILYILSNTMACVILGAMHQPCLSSF